jgi:hypothetical protein
MENFSKKICSENQNTFYVQYFFSSKFILLMKLCGTVRERLSGFGGLGVNALAFGIQVRGFKPGRSRRIFQGEKFLSAPSFGS